MMNYVIYQSMNGDGDYIVEVLNYSNQDILDVQRVLVKQGFIILKLCDRFIKCYKEQSTGEE